MKYVALLMVLAVFTGCDSDPFMARKGGYMPGQPYHHHSGLYPGMPLNQGGA